MPAHGRRLRRQGEPGGAMGLPRRARSQRDRLGRQAPPRPRRRHDHDRQAPRLQGRLQLRLRRAGRLVAVDGALNARCGYSADLSMAVCDRAMFHADNAYYYPSARILSRRVKTDTVSNTAFRGFGGPQGMMLAERMMDDIACRLGLDPLDVRKRNLYGRGRDITPYGMKVGDNILPRLVRELEKTSDYRERRKGIAAFNRGQPVSQEGDVSHAREVRDRLHAEAPQPGGRAGARLYRRLRAGEPRRHRDGAGAPHQGRAGGGGGVRHRLRAGEDHRDEDRHGAQHHARPPRRPAPI